MPSATESTPPTQLSGLDAINHVVRLVKEYFLESEQSYWALLFLLGIVLSVVSSVALTVVMTWNINAFFQALTVMNLPLFIQSMEILLALFVGLSVIKFITSTLTDMLAANWREWLTLRLLNQLTRDEQYLRLNREHSELRHIEVTPVDSIRDFVNLTVSLSKDLLKKSLSLPIYLRTLWITGGALTLVVLGTSITIPGFLVFAAILFAVVSTILSHVIGRSLKDWLHRNTQAEAHMRNEIAFVNAHAESIGLAGTINHHQETFREEANNIHDNSYQMAQIQAAINAFNEFSQYISFIFPYVIAAPLYFAKKITEGEIFSVGYAFGEAQYALSWFINSYEYLSLYIVCIERIIALENALLNEHHNLHQSIAIQQTELNTLRVENLSISKTNASSTEYIMRNLNLTLDPQKNTFIRGESGVGKSTLFKALAGTWKQGEGDIFLPANSRLCFLPQTPLIPANLTLKELLDYSDSNESHTQEEYENVLRATGMEAFISSLEHTNKDWDRTLSGGQKQTIAFARVLLKREKPALLFLDESTSAMDEDRQALMYKLLKNLSHTKVISIAHNSSAIKFHDEVIDLSVDEERNVFSTRTSVV